MHYAIGDIQGCCSALDALLAQLPEDAEQLFFMGDLINRGPESLRTLRTVMGLGNQAKSILGNHELHLLAVAAGVRKAHASDTLDDILNAPDRETLIDWIRNQPLAIFEHNHLFVHAGVLPQWDISLTLSLAQEIESELRSPHWKDFLAYMFGNMPDIWAPNLARYDRQRLAINALTRLRFCSIEGQIEFACKQGPALGPPGFMPWFDIPHRKTQQTTIVFGHWSAAGLVLRDHLIGTDTGCVWGGKLTAVGLHPDPKARPVIHTV